MATLSPNTIVTRGGWGASCLMSRTIDMFLFFLLLLSYGPLRFVSAHDVFLPPPPPISCDAPAASINCTVQSFQGIWPDGKPCKAALALFPTSEAQLFQAVALASKTRSKLRVVSGGSHSFTKLVCPGGDEGIIISTQNYNTDIRVNLTSQRVTADAGVGLRDLVDKIAEYGLTLPHTPFYEGLSVGGMISTGAHGSGMLGKGSAPHDYVVGMRLIIAGTEEEGYAKVVEMVEGDEDLDAARLSLGVLGAVSTVTFQLEPMFKRCTRIETREDERLEEEIEEFAQRHEFGLATWYPSLRQVLFRVEDRVPADTPGNGALKIALMDKMEVSALEIALQNSLLVEERHDTEELCVKAKKAFESCQTLGVGHVNNVDGTFTGYPVVGFNHNMQTSGGCEGKRVKNLSHRVGVTATSILFDSPVREQEDEHDYPLKDFIMPLDSKVFTCGWNPLFRPFWLSDISISIPISCIKEVLLEMKKLRDLYPSSMCKLELHGGIVMRFLGPSTAYLGETGKSVMLEFLYFRSKKAPETPTLHVDIVDEIEQMLLSKFKGKPHWGKNRNIAFENMRMRTRNMEKFLEARERYDPLGLFSSEWSDAILGIDSSSTHPHQVRPLQSFQDYCAVKGLCVCTNDLHCNPSKNYFCRKGHIYEQAQVCRYEAHGSPKEASYI